MLNIELPYIDGYKLIIRWFFNNGKRDRLFHEHVEKLHHCIFGLGLPVYNFKKELQEGIVDEVEYAMSEHGYPLFMDSDAPKDEYYKIGTDKRNALYFFNSYVKNRHLFDHEDAFFSSALGRIRTKDRTHLHADIWDILKCMYFKMEDVKDFEAKHQQRADLTPQNKVTGIVIPKIEVPWMNGKRLMERWSINLDELYQTIFSLHLPVYDSDYNKQDRIIWEESTTTTGGIYGDEPRSYTFPPNNLYELHQLSLVPSWPYIWGGSVDEVLCSLYFTIEDVKEFEVKHGMGRKETSQQDIPSASHKDEPVETDAENFVRNLRVSYENDSEITIKIPTKKAGVFTYDDLGFKDNEVWKAFIYTIKEPPHIYETGPAHIKKGGEKERISQYDTKMGRLRSINKKLIVFFNQEYAAQLPEGFKLYEPCKEEGTGKYKFQFQVSRDDGIEEDYHSTYEQLPEDKLIDEVKALFKKYSATNDQVVERRFVVALNVAIEKGLLSDDEVNKMFNLDSSRWSSWEKKEYPHDDLRDDDLHEV